jgi:hypothetical protein
VSKSKIRRSSELPDHEGFVFVAYSQGAPFGAFGRRGNDGELYVNSLLLRAPGSPETVEELKDQAAGFTAANGIPVEIVTGKEADDLLAAIEKEEKAKRPFFVFVRTPNIETETGIELAGRLFIDMPAKKFKKKAGEETADHILKKHRSDTMDPHAVVYGWTHGKPYCGDEITDNDELMRDWAAKCVMALIRVNDGEFDISQDNEARVLAGVASDGSLLN